MEVALKRIVENVFSNWTGLQMAVEHSFGGPSSKLFANQFVDDIVNYLISDTHAEVDDISAELEDAMDEVFNTMCEDNSTREIAELLYNFTKLLKAGNFAQCEIEYNNLTPPKPWLLQPQTSTQQNSTLDSSDDSSSSDDEAMEEDPGWTTVKPRRKK